MSPFRRLLVLLAAAAVSLLITGCGGGDGSSQVDSPTTSEVDGGIRDGAQVPDDGNSQNPVPSGPIDSADLPDAYAMDVADSPFGLAASEEAVWVSNGPADTVSRVDRRTGTVTAIRVGADPYGIAIGSDAVWVTLRGDNAVSRIDVVSNSVTDTIEVGERPEGIVATNDGIWVTLEGEDSVSRIDPETRRVTDVVEVGEEPAGIASTGDAVWVANTDDDTVSRIDPESRSVTDTITVDDEPIGISVIAGAVWVDSDDGTLVRIDPTTRTVASIISVNDDRDSVTTGASDGDVWVIEPGSLSRIDPETESVAVTSRLERVISVVESHGSLWVVTLGDLYYAPAVLKGEEPIKSDPEGVVRRIDPTTLIVSLEGHLLNAVDDAPMPGVIVVPCLEATVRNRCVIDAAQTVETSIDGSFTIPVSEPGRYVILYSIDGAARPDWDGLEFQFETRSLDVLAALTEFFGEVDSLQSPFVIRNLDDEGPTGFSGYFHSGNLGLGSVWVESAPISAKVTPAGGFVDLRIWDGVRRPEDFDPIIASTDDPGDDDEGLNETHEEVSAAELGAQFLDSLLVYPSMRDAVSGDELECAARQAPERFTSAEIDQLAGANPPESLVAEVGRLFDECFNDSTMSDVLSAAFVEGAGLAKVAADCIADFVTSLPTQDLVTLMVTEDAAELPAELFNQLMDATGSCLSS